MSLKSEIQGFDISGKSAAIIGCGGLGTNVSVHLAGAGIGSLLLVDFDVVEKRNLNRQFMFTAEDKGREKCDILAARLAAYAPECEIKTRQKKIEKTTDLADALEYDIIIAALDNIIARRIINDTCKLSKKPCINGSINGFFGMAYLYVPGETPDFEAAGLLNESSVKNLSPSVTAGITGALEAKLAIDYFLNDKSSQGVLLCYDGITIQTLKIKE